MDPALYAGAAVLVLSSIGGTVVLIINAWSASKDRREAAAERLQQLTIAVAAARTADATSKKADVLIEGNAKIHELTNSTNSQLQKALELKTQELASVRELMAQMERTAKEIAATRIVTDLQASVALHAAAPVVERVAAPSGQAEASLKEIAVSTDATATNTQRTDAKVDALKPG